MGFVFRFMSEARKARNEQFKQMIQGRKVAVESADSAAARDGGKLVRRFLVVSVVVALIGFPFLAATMGINTYVELTQTSREYFWGLIGGHTATTYEEVGGYLLVEQNRTVLLAISSFYFGQAAGK
jgi:hypothetical protein